MDYISTGIILASIYGPMMAIEGLWCLLHPDKLTKVLSQIRNSPGLLYYTSITYLFFGFLFLNLYQVWSWNLLVLVTVLGWTQTIRGVLGFYAPHILFDFGEKNPWFIKFYGIIPLVWGLLLCWAAFFM